MEHIKNYMLDTDEKCAAQIETIAKHPAFADETIRIMPDGHSGKGCVVGFTSTFSDKVIPNIVGVDIACRVSMYETPFTWADVNNRDKKFLAQFDDIVHAKVPAGLGQVRNDVHRNVANHLMNDINSLRCHDKLRDLYTILLSVGSLGTGNHFIELDRDMTQDKVYLIVHTGSRNLGVQVCNYYQQKAIERCNKELKERQKKDIEYIVSELKEAGRPRDIQKALKEYKENHTLDFSKELCYIEGDLLQDYLHDMDVCNKFSYYNHVTIIEEIMASYGIDFYPNKLTTCIHNYIDTEHKIIRKGAISAQEGEIAIIPMNMRDGIMTMVGKGNPDWNYSLPHGCGRNMSRTEARKNIDLLDYQVEMEDVYSTCINESTIDESPMAYKNPEDVLDVAYANGRPNGLYTPVYSFKGV